MSDGVWRAVCEIYAPELGDASAATLHAAIIESRRWFWSDPERSRTGRLDLDAVRRQVALGGLNRLGVDNPALAEEIASVYTAEHEQAIRPFPGALDTLSRLQSGGVRLALVTQGTGAGQRKKIERFGLEKFFDYILIEAEFGAGKPDERVYRHALEQLGVTPSEAWMVGDNLEFDVAGPQKLGICGIWIDHAGKGVPALSKVRPDRIVVSISELI
ncbi:MAG: HAD family hydrolase [Chloroflexi bacterium]|nr:HAD family hydrolase [Chloroflexota bacterium]